MEMEIQFESIENLALIWVWNYNVSRTDLYKGVKLLRFTFDNRLIFIGIIKQASGRVENCKKNFENILLTDDEEVAKKISSKDEVF